MTAGIEPSTTPIESDDAERYMLRDPREIVRVLQALTDNRALISAHLMPGGRPCPTALLEVDGDEVLIDGNRDETLNLRVLASDYLVCVSQLDRVRVQFRLQHLRRVDGDGPVAFAAPLPESVLQLQRRELYRLELVPGPVVTVQVQLQTVPTDAPPLPVRVLDISGGGLALGLTDEDQAHFTQGRQFDTCTLELPDGGEPMRVRLQVAHISQRQELARYPVRAGCRFVGLSALAERRILQFIFQVERQRKARERRAV